MKCIKHPFNHRLLAKVPKSRKNLTKLKVSSAIANFC